MMTFGGGGGDGGGCNTFSGNNVRSWCLRFCLKTARPDGATKASTCPAGGGLGGDWYAGGRVASTRWYSVVSLMNSGLEVKNCPNC